MNIYTAKQITETLQQQDENVNLRTVRYYTQIGLVPPLELSGNKRVYTENHLHYFRAIRTLSKAGESLQSIQEKLQSLSLDEVKKIAELMPFYQSDKILNNEIHQVNEDVYITLSPRISAELRQKVINSVSHVLKGDKNEC